MVLRPAAAGRPRFDIGDIVRQHRATLEAQRPLTLQQRRVLSAIALCRTAALGGHVDVCRSCGHEHPAYNSCRNRPCPKCQALAQEKWSAARWERLLPAAHFHVVFTLPSELRRLTKSRPRQVYSALISAAKATLLQLGQSRLKAQLGITMVLHTWTRDLRYHPHVHAIVTAGGLSLDGQRWLPSKPKYLFPVKVMGKLFAGKMIAELRGLHRAGVFGRLDWDKQNKFASVISKVARKSWVVYVKKPFRRVDHVMAYLGRYTHRVAIANSRLVNVSEDAVTFRTKNGKTVTLPPVTFLARLVQHVLPDGFHKIRHCGLYSSAHARAQGKLHTARQLLASNVPEPVEANLSTNYEDQLHQLTGRDVTRCIRCGGPLYRVLVTATRPPPNPVRMAA